MSPSEMDQALTTVMGVAAVGLAVAVPVLIGAAVREYRRGRPGRLPFVRSSSWWVDAAGRTARPARHRVRLAWTDPAGRARAVRASVRRRVRRVAIATAVLVDELTLSARLVTA